MGTVISIAKQWRLKINTKPVRTHALDGATFPYIIRVKYTVDNKEYIKRKWISAGSSVPSVEVLQQSAILRTSFQKRRCSNCQIPVYQVDSYETIEGVPDGTPSVCGYSNSLCDKAPALLAAAFFVDYFSNVSATSPSSSRMFRCWGQTASHWPHWIQALALPPDLV